MTFYTINVANSFVHNFIRIIALIGFLAVPLWAQVGLATSQKREKNVEQKTVKASSTRPIDFFSRKKIDLVKELDDVMREMIWLIRSERPSANKTLFGKVYRALQQVRGVKLTEKNKHTCDQYSVEKDSMYQYRIYEHCQKHRSPDLLAKMDWSHNQVVFQFSGQNYADVLGLAASLVAPIVDCQVNFDEQEALSYFKCTGFRITRGENVVRFETVIYKKSNDPLIVLKGEVLKDLLPYSDLTISVPRVGKVAIKEKKKVPDMDETTPEQKAKDLQREKQKQEPIKALPPYPVAVDPRRPENNDPQANVDPTQSPREGEGSGINAVRPSPNNDLRKNADPDVIEIKETPHTR